MAKAPKLVVFDWGGVVLRICRSWAEGCERAGVDMREPETALSATQNPATLRLLAAYETGAIDHQGFTSQLSELMDHRYSTDEIDAIHDAWLIEEYAGVPELIENLVELGRSTGLQTGLLSNTNARHWAAHLSPAEGGTGRFPAVRRLQHRHASHQLGRAKPDEAIYTLFEHHTGFECSDILFFDDRADNIETARRIGWNAELIDHTGDTANQIRGFLAQHRIVV